ncbi:uncharacterized protein LOC122322877 [Drosophila grimshawi]|uniref:uncharacterized protein LOC122322877 n=1 Tax=Drosophila grimshawi TaxID=7222 RepID=UPI001C9343FB|nr:uncharacterized protein LOC122322877 [Drosophila grimshawi]
MLSKRTSIPYSAASNCIYAICLYCGLPRFVISVILYMLTYICWQICGTEPNQTHQTQPSHASTAHINDAILERLFDANPQLEKEASEVRVLHFCCLTEFLEANPHSLQQVVSLEGSLWHSCLALTPHWPVLDDRHCCCSCQINCTALSRMTIGCAIGEQVRHVLLAATGAFIMQLLLMLLLAKIAADRRWLCAAND